MEIIYIFVNLEKKLALQCQTIKTAVNPQHLKVKDTE